MLFGKRNKAQFNESISNGDDEVANIELDGSGYSQNGKSMWRFRILGGKANGDNLNVRGNDVNISTDADGYSYIEFE